MPCGQAAVCLAAPCAGDAAIQHAGDARCGPSLPRCCCLTIPSCHEGVAYQRHLFLAGKRKVTWVVFAAMLAG